MNKTYIPTLITSALLAVLHFLASEGHWYVRYPGFDILMHLLGGMTLALAIYWTIVTFFPRYRPSFLRIVVATFILGIGWEVMETIYDIAGAPVGTTKYYWDSIHDLINDTIGAAIIAFFVKK